MKQTELLLYSEIYVKDYMEIGKIEIGLLLVIYRVVGLSYQPAKSQKW